MSAAYLSERQHVRWQLILAAAAFFMFGAHDGAIGILLLRIQSFYHIDLATVSFLFIGLSVGYLTASLNAGFLQPRVGIRLYLLLGIGAFIVGTGSQLIYWPFPIFLCSMIIIGFGIGVLDTGINTYFSSNAVHLNTLHGLYGAGALSGPLIASSFVALNQPWQQVYLVWGSIGCILLLGIWIYYPTRQETAQSQETAKTGLFTVSRLPIVWIAALFFLIYVGAEAGIGNWSFSSLVKYRDVPIFLAGWLVSGYWCGLTLGRLVLGRRAQQVGNTRLISECLTGVLVGLLVASLVPGAIGAGIGLVITGFFLGPLFPTMIAWMSLRVPTPLLAGTIGLLTSVGNIGSAIFPWLAGRLFQWLGFGVLFPYIFLLTLILLGCWSILLRMNSPDQADKPA